MGKSRAELQKAYRARKKPKLGKDYLRTEHERVKGYYDPAAVLNEGKRMERNKKNKLRNQISRSRKNERLRALVVRESSDE